MEDNTMKIRINEKTVLEKHNKAKHKQERKHKPKPKRLPVVGMGLNN